MHKRQLTFESPFGFTLVESQSQVKSKALTREGVVKENSQDVLNKLPHEENIMSFFKGGID